MNRGYNFGAGPAMLPEELLLEVQTELLNWQDSGMSVMEIGHRTKEFVHLMEQAEQQLRDLLTIPDNYHVLFLGGPARLQFSMIPMNFLAKEHAAGYLISGLWSSMALEEASRLKQAYCVASSEKTGFTSIPDIHDYQLKNETSYVYYTPNETVNGVRFSKPPTMGDTPLIADMTSCLLSEPVSIADYGLIFAGAQKNIANAGLTVVIVRDELIQTINNDSLPLLLDYRTHITHKSLYATPPTFNCYVALKMFEWVQRQGGVSSIYNENRAKAHKLYQVIDTSDFYHCKVAVADRSLMNVCFTLTRPEQEELFLSEAKDNGLLALRGHRTVGGLRASLYNSMPMEGVDRLIEFMIGFAKRGVTH